MTLKGSQRRFLKSQANTLKPLVHIGKQGLTDTVVSAINEGLDDHELIKIKFLDFKDEKAEISANISDQTNCHVVGQIGHVVILYRQHPEAEKRKIKLPT